MTDAHVRRLFRRLRDQGDPTARTQLVELHLPMAHRLANRYHSGLEPTEDLRQVAALGLINAVDRFDPDRAGSFSSFAVPTILGELKRHFRDRGWTVHVNRSTQELVLKVRRARRQFEDGGRTPTASALAEELGVEVERVLEALEASQAQYARSYDPPAGEGDAELAASMQPWLATTERGYDQVEMRDAFDRATGLLDGRSQQVLELYYAEDLSQSEVAERIGVSQMQVSRIMARAHDRLGGPFADRLWVDPDG